MGTAMSNALVLAGWHGFREFRHAGNHRIIFLGGSRDGGSCLGGVDGSAAEAALVLRR